MTGQELRQVRLALALTQKEFAERLGIKENTLAIKEMGRLAITKRDIKILNIVSKERLDEIVKSFEQVDASLRKYAGEM